MLKTQVINQATNRCNLNFLFDKSEESYLHRVHTVARKALLELEPSACKGGWNHFPFKSRSIK